MGCDIHAVLESKNDQGEWKLAFERSPHKLWWYEQIIDQDFDYVLTENLIVLDTGGDPYEVLANKLETLSKEQIIVQYGNDPRVRWEWNTPSCFDDRNYGLFSILAGVRNYDGAPCISDPRGLPSDVTAAVKGESDSWGIDGHSHSWVTLQELVDFRWDDPLTESGIVEEKEYTPGKRPQMYCRGVGGPGVVIVKEKDWIKKTKRDGKRYYIEASWETDIQEHIGEWWLESFKELLTKFNDKDLNNIRVVFFFDN